MEQGGAPGRSSAPRRASSTSRTRAWRRPGDRARASRGSSARSAPRGCSPGATPGCAACGTRTTRRAGQIFRDAITLARIAKVVAPLEPHRAPVPVFTLRDVHSPLPAVAVDVTPVSARSIEELASFCTFTGSGFGDPAWLGAPPRASSASAGACVRRGVRRLGDGARPCAAHAPPRRPGRHRHPPIRDRPRARGEGWRRSRLTAEPPHGLRAGYTCR